jgi:HK97 family phage portal protein
VRLIAETLATLPLGFFLRKPDGSPAVANTHGLYEILHDQPNADMTAVVFWEIVVAAMLLWGNAFIEIIRSADIVVALNWLHPARMKFRRLPNGSIEYRYIDEAGSSKDRIIPEGNMMHIPAFSIDGKCGLSPIVYGANVFGTAIETDRTSAQVFTKSMRSPGIVTMDMLFKPAQREEVREHVKKVSEDGGIMVLEKGAKFEPLTFNPVDVELLASRSWNVEEICRWFRIDPAMVGHGGKDSNWGTGLEQKMIWFLTFTLRHWCKRIEQAVRKDLLTPVERTRYFAKFSIEGLLRADSASRAAFYSVMVQNGIMTRDQVRQLEDWAPMGGNAGVLTVQSNLLPIDKLGESMPGSAARNELMAWLGIEPTAAVAAKE